MPQRMPSVTIPGLSPMRPVPSHTVTAGPAVAAHRPAGTGTVGPEVVIVGEDGREHVFPPGFDPKRAAAIVRQRAGASGGDTLAARVRAKYPGAYDDLTDQQLEEAVLAKYPEYGDLPRSRRAADYAALAKQHGGRAVDGSDLDAVKARVLAKAPDNMSEAEFNAWLPGAWAAEMGAKPTGQYRLADARPVEPREADPARRILDNARLPGAVKAQLSNAFDQAKDTADLQARLDKLTVPKPIKAALRDAKQAQTGQSATQTTETVVEIPGVGNIAFPASMNEAQINEAAGRLYREARGRGSDDAQDRGVLHKIGDTVADVAIGAGKRLLKTAETGGAYLRKIPGVSALDRLVAPINLPVNLEPANTAQSIGGVIEQTAEIASPSRAIYKTGLKAAEVGAPILSRILGQTAGRLAPRAAVEAVGNAALAKMQGATNPEAGVTAAVSAAVPTIGAAAVKLAKVLREGAAADVGRFFQATTKPLKRVVGKRTDEILDRGAEVLGRAGRSREAAAEVFTTVRQQSGEAIDDALSLYGSQEVKDAPARLVAALDKAKAHYVTERVMASETAVPPPYRRYITETLTDGRVRVALPRNADKVRQIEGLKALVQAHGDSMTIDELVGLRRAWDEIAYAKPGTTLETVRTQAAKWARKMGGDAIRAEIETARPDLAKLNRQFSFWRDLETVMTATIERKRGQAGGLLAPMAENAGRVVGGVLGASHGPGGAIGGAILVGKGAKLAQRVFESPRYASLSAVVKTQLAKALASGNAAAANHWILEAAMRTGVVAGPRAVGAAID